MRTPLSPARAEMFTTAYSINLAGIDNELKSEILSRLPADTLLFSSKYVMSLEETITLGGSVRLDTIIRAVFPQTSDKYSVLVNKTHAFDESYLDRVKIIKRMPVYGEERAIEEETSKALDELIAFADTIGIKIGFCSGYRSIAYQQKMLDTYPEIYGDDFRPEIIAQPGYSEHHTGLAVDLAIYWDGRWVDDNYPDEAVAAFEKLHPYLHRFGFILRYPDGLEDITGYPYEPWHIRYVGKAAAPAYYISGRHIPLEQLA